MNHKQIAKLNGKLLQDATEYLTYVRQLENIRMVFAALGDRANRDQVEFLKEIQPIAEGAMEVVDEVMVATKALKELPSSAPRHKRRAAVASLNETLHSRADHIGEVFHAIMKSATLIDNNLEDAEKEVMVEKLAETVADA